MNSPLLLLFLLLYLALRANDQVRRFINIHVHYICFGQLTYSFILRWNIDYDEAKLVTNSMFADYINNMPEFAEVSQWLDG